MEMTSKQIKEMIGGLYMLAEAIQTHEAHHQEIAEAISSVADALETVAVAITGLRPPVVTPRRKWWNWK